MKACGRCKHEKPESEFYAASKGGLQSYCKECAGYMRVRYKATGSARIHPPIVLTEPAAVWATRTMK